MPDRTEFIPLGGSPQGTDASSSTLYVEQICNFVPILSDPAIGGKKQLRMAKRRGYQNLMVASASGYSINQGLQWTGKLGSSGTPRTDRGVIVYTAWKSATDLKLYRWTTSETTLGTYAGADYLCIGIQETLISGVPNLTLNVVANQGSGAQKLLFFPDGGALTEVTDGDFPSTSVGCGVHMDGYYFIASSDGYIYNSDVNSLSAWTATSKIAVQMKPDTLVGLARIRNIIVAFGTQSIEFFQNAGNASGSPLQRISQSALKMGAFNGISMQEIGENIVFISNGPDGVGVHMLEGYAVRKVSTPFIDQVLGQIISTPTYNLYVGFNGIVKQHGTVAANLITSGLPTGAYLYYPEFNLWTKNNYAGSTTWQNPVFQAGGLNFAIDPLNNIVWADGLASNAAATATSGKDYNAMQFEAFIQTVPMTHGTAHRKFYKSARLIGDQQTVATPVIYSGSDDNGATFQTYGTFDMSVNPISPITRMGSSRKRIHKFSNNSAGGCVIDGVELTYEIGSN